MTTHTPGPWQVTHEDPTQVCDSDGEMRGCSPIAQCTVGTKRERKANARLIAAAPELLDALRKLAKLYDAMGAPRGACRILADAAIAKAKGKAP